MSRLDDIKARAEIRRGHLWKVRKTGMGTAYIDEAERDLDRAIALAEGFKDAGVIARSVTTWVNDQLSRVRTDNALLAQHNADLIREIEKTRVDVLKLRDAVARGVWGPEIDRAMAVTEHYEQYRLLITKTGKVLTDADIEALADEAERGYDVSKLKERPEK